LTVGCLHFFHVWQAGLFIHNWRP